MIFFIFTLVEKVASQNQSRKVVKKKTKRKQPSAKPSLIDEKNDWNEEMFPFRGTKELYEEAVSVKVEQISDTDEEDWNETKPSVGVKLENALGAIMGAYMSDDDEEEECIKPVNDEQVVVKHSSDTEMPEEVKMVKKEPVEEVVEVITKEIKGRKRKKRQKGNNIVKRSVQNERTRDNFPYKFQKRRVTLLEKLLENEIRDERNVLLQCVKYVVKNEFFK